MTPARLSPAHDGAPRGRYQPPAGDHAPLDPIEAAIARALVAILLPELKAELAERAPHTRDGDTP